MENKKDPQYNERYKAAKAQVRADAKQKVKDIKNFFIHLIVFIAVVVTVVPFNAFYTPANYWFYFPFLIWGIIVVNQGLITFTNGGLFGKAWEERKIKKFMEK